MRQFLRNTVRLRPFLGETAVRVHEWAVSVKVDGLDVHLKDLSSAEAGASAPDLIECIAEALLIEQPQPIREILSKSLQETLFYCTGADPDISYSQLKTRLVQFLNRRGPAALVRRFVALSLFNVIWFRTGDSFRAIAPSTASFERDMYSVERLCRRIAAASWKSHDLMSRPLELGAVDGMIRTIEKRLRDGEQR